MITKQAVEAGRLPGYEYLGEMRLSDLVAKTAKVSRKDTIRVLIAVHALCKEFGLTLDDIVPEGYVFESGKASPSKFLACEQAYIVLEGSRGRGLAAIRKYKR